MSNSTARAKQSKPAFPLFKHATGRWCKKVHGSFRYFGKVTEDPDGERTLQLWAAQKDDLLAGRRPAEHTDVLTVKELCNQFLAAKVAKKLRGELSPRTFHEYYHTCGLILCHLGKSTKVTDVRPSDFSKLTSKAFDGKALSTRGAMIQRVRTVFNFAHNGKQHLIDKPVLFGEAFDPPGKTAVAKDRNARKDSYKLTAEQIRALVDAAGVYLKPMILLGINCGFGNHDCGTLTLSALDLAGGWVCHPRPKTGEERKAKLWPETVAALKAAIDARRVPADGADADLVFVTQTGQAWVRWTGKHRSDADASKSSWTDSVNTMARLLFKKLGINGGASFYSLRRMCRTVGGGCRDERAIDIVMGHHRDDMGTTYTLDFEESRLEAVADVIHAWLFPENAQNSGSAD